jgi:hypothetical protein
MNCDQCSNGWLLNPATNTVTKCRRCHTAGTRHGRSLLTKIDACIREADRIRADLDLLSETQHRKDHGKSNPPMVTETREPMRAATDEERYEAAKRMIETEGEFNLAAAQRHLWIGYRKALDFADRLMTEGLLIKVQIPRTYGKGTYTKFVAPTKETK